MRHFWWVLFLLSLQLGAQEVTPLQSLENRTPISQYVVDSWDNENGLPTNAILDVAKTNQGFMWLATFNGLARFDGMEFKIYDKSNTPELQTNNLSSLLVDSKDQLWIGTNGGGLLKLARGKFHYFNTDSIVNSSVVTALEESQEGIIWVGTRFGLAQLVNDTLTKIKTGPLSFRNITTLHADNRGRLWVGTATNGLYVLDNGKTINLTTAHGLKSNFIRAAFGDSHGNIWVGTDQGVALIDDLGVHSLDSVPGAPLVFTNAFLEDQQGFIWMGSNDGLRRFGDKFEILPQDHGLSQNIVQTLLQDDEGNIWAGTYRGGLNRLKQGKFLSIGKPEGLSNDVINVTYVDESMLWIGSDDGVTCLRDGILNNFSLGRLTAGNRIRDIYRDSQQRLWFCTYRGLVQFENGRIVKRYTTDDGMSSNNTRRIVEDKDGALWIGTASGVNRIKNGVIDVYGVESGLRDQFVMSLYIDHSNQLWVGTDGGGVYIFMDNKFVRALSSDAENDIVFNILQDFDGSYWFSTNRGVVFLNDSLEFNLTPMHGLISNNIFQVLLDNRDQVWFTSDRGLMKSSINEVHRLVNGELNKFVDSRLFDRSDGLRTSQITAASKSTQTSDGKLWIATLKGVALVDTEQIPINEILPKTALTLIKSDNDVQSLEGTIRLPAGVRRLEVHYTGLSFYAPNKVKYKYKLENFDDQWVDAGDLRTAYYTNIPPGDYIFKVIASNNDGVWNRKPAFASFYQEAFFYQTRWFYILMAILLIALGAFMYYLRALELKRRNVLLTRLVKERTWDIQKQNDAISNQREELQQLNLVKDKLLSVISHDLRGPIAAVAGLLGLLKSGHLNYQELMTQSSSLNNEVHGLTYLLDNLLNWSKSQMQGININRENIQLKKLVRDTLRVIKPMSDHKYIKIINEVPEECYVHTDTNLLSLVIRNLIMNAIKFTHHRGEIRIGSNVADDWVTITVNDNGVGIGKKDLERLFNSQSHYSKMGTANEAGTGIGLLLCKEFLELDGGRIWAESEKGKGSSFKFTLQLGYTASQA